MARNQIINPEELRLRTQTQNSDLYIVYIIILYYPLLAIQRDFAWPAVMRDFHLETDLWLDYGGQVCQTPEGGGNFGDSLRICSTQA